MSKSGYFLLKSIKSLVVYSWVSFDVLSGDKLVMKFESDVSTGMYNI